MHKVEMRMSMYVTCSRCGYKWGKSAIPPTESTESLALALEMAELSLIDCPSCSAPAVPSGLPAVADESAIPDRLKDR